MKVRIAHFDQCKLEPWDYPEEEVTMTEQEFDALVAHLYFDMYVGMWYTNDNSTGYEILEF